MAPQLLLKRLVLATALLSGIMASGLCLAQYEWRDANGHMVISDQPPPPGTKPSQIIKSQPMPASQPMSVSAPQSSGAKAPMSLSDKDQAFKKRQQARAEAEKAAAEKQAAADQKAKYCDALAVKLRTLQSGIRINQVDKSGEVRTMDSNERQNELSKTTKDIASQCS